VKVGQIYPVFLRTGQGEYEVAQAQLLEIDGDEAILEIPGTRIVMGISTSLGDLPVNEPLKERVFDGVVADNGDDGSDAVDDVRALYAAEGIELDEDPDEQSSGRVIGRSGAPRAASAGSDGVSLRDMALDDEV